jgi:hypothetical protein
MKFSSHPRYLPYSCATQYVLLVFLKFIHYTIPSPSPLTTPELQLLHFPAVHTSRTAILFHTHLHDTMTNVNVMFILEVFMEPTHVHLSATTCQTATQNCL